MIEVKDNRATKNFTLKASDIVDGHAYEDQYGTIFIGNKYQRVSAFSICGDSIISDNSPTTLKFREVNLSVVISHI